MFDNVIRDLTETLDQSSGEIRHRLDSVCETEVSFDSIYEGGKKAMESKLPNLDKDNIDVIRKKLLEMADNTEPNEPADDNYTYIGSSGDNSYYGEIETDDNGRVLKIEVYAVDGDKVSTISNDEGVDNVFIIDKLVDDLSLDSVSYKLLKDLGIIQSLETPEGEKSEEKEENPEEEEKTSTLPEETPEEEEKNPEESLAKKLLKKHGLVEKKGEK